MRNESAGLRLAKDDSVWIALVNCRTEPGVDCFQSSYEENYQQLAAQAVPDARLAYLPITVKTAGGYLGFTESDPARLSGTVVASRVRRARARR